MTKSLYLVRQYLESPHSRKMKLYTIFYVITSSKDIAENVVNAWNEDYFNEEFGELEFSSLAKKIKVPIKKIKELIEKSEREGQNNPWGTDIDYKNRTLIITD